MLHTDPRHLALADWQRRIATPDGQSFAVALERGELLVELYRPEKADHQQPHDRDECYVVVEGSGRFVMGEDSVMVKAGDFLFVPAGMPHRFTDFGESLTAWVIFYGPRGGMREAMP